jgi:uncharacterized protein YjcR
MQTAMEARDLWASGLFRVQEIADFYGVHRRTVTEVLNGHRWKVE